MKRSPPVVFQGSESFDVALTRLGSIGLVSWRPWPGSRELVASLCCTVVGERRQGLFLRLLLTYILEILHSRTYAYRTLREFLNPDMLLTGFSTRLGAYQAVGGEAAWSSAGSTNHVGVVAVI